MCTNVGLPVALYALFVLKYCRFSMFAEILSGVLVRSGRSYPPVGPLRSTHGRNIYFLPP